MANILDVVLIGGGAYYLANKLSDDEDDNFNRLLIGTAVGVPAALKGPEIYENLKSRSSGMSQEDKDRLISAAAFAGIGYLFGDRLGYSLRGKKDEG